MSGDALEIVREWKERPVLDREAQGKRSAGNDAVFTNTLGGPILPDTIYRGLRALCAAAGVPYLGARLPPYVHLHTGGQWAARRSH